MAEMIGTFYFPTCACGLKKLNDIELYVSGLKFLVDPPPPPPPLWPSFDWEGSRKLVWTWLTWFASNFGADPPLPPLLPPPLPPPPPCWIKFDLIINRINRHVSFYKILLIIVQTLRKSFISSGQLQTIVNVDRSGNTFKSFIGLESNASHSHNIQIRSFSRYIISRIYNNHNSAMLLKVLIIIK